MRSWLKILNIWSIILLTSNSHEAIAQQKFVDITNVITNYKSVRSVTSIDSNYYFLCLTHANNAFIQSQIYKTNYTGNLIDSLSFPIYNYNDSIKQFFMFSNDNYIELMGLKAKYDSAFTSHAPILFRYRYDKNFNFIDSFENKVNSVIPFQNLVNLRKYKDKIYYITSFSHPSITNNTNRANLFILDSSGQYLGEKILFSNVSDYVDFLPFSDTNFLLSVYAQPLGVNYPSNLLCILNSNFDTTNSKSDTKINFIKSSFNEYNSTFFLRASEILGATSASPDSLRIELVEYNLSEQKTKTLPRFSQLNSLAYKQVTTYAQQMFSNKNNFIFFGQNWGNGSLFNINSYYDIHCLDSNLNIRWSRLLGGELPYEIISYQALNDGSCFIMGARRLDSASQYAIEPIVFKIDSSGMMTSVYSFEKSAQHLFQIYPNPSLNYFFIHNRGATEYEIMIWDVASKLVYHKKGIKDELIKIDLQEIPRGLYIYKIFTKDNNAATGKLQID